jgi:DNA gyrase subunit A
MYERAQAYGSYANKDRALPDVRDGLKPVQRRILYSMSNGQLNVTASRPRQKCALIVGHAMGRFHPHGDSAIYGALVRMGQDFSMSIPLIDKQGNFGSVGPQAYSDPPAAYRYTEARLSKIATDSLSDLHQEIV